MAVTHARTIPACSGETHGSGGGRIFGTDNLLSSWRSFCSQHWIFATKWAVDTTEGVLKSDRGSGMQHPEAASGGDIAFPGSARDPFRPRSWRLGGSELQSVTGAGR